MLGYPSTWRMIWSLAKQQKQPTSPDACAPLILSLNQWLRLLLWRYITKTLASILSSAAEREERAEHTPQCEKKGRRRRRRKICPDLVALNRSSSSK